MLNIVLETPRAHGFTEEELAPWKTDWPTWPTSRKPDPFDFDASLELATSHRYDTWLYVSGIDRINDERDGHVGEQEAAFWASLLVSPEYVVGDVPKDDLDPEDTQHPRRGWVEQFTGKVEPGVDADTLLELCGPTIEALEMSDRSPDDVYRFMGRVMRWHIPWVKAFTFARDRISAGNLYAFVQGLGIAPEHQSAQATALVREVFDSIDLDAADDYDMKYRIARLLLAAPAPDLIVRFFEAWKATHEKPETLDYVPPQGLVFCLSDVKTFTKVLKSLDFMIFEKNIDAVFGRFGYAGVEPLMRHGLKPRKGRPGIATLRRALWIVAPEVIEQLQPLANKGGDWAAEVRRYIDAAPAEHAAHGLIACCNRAGKKRTWAVEELRLLSEREGGSAAIEDALSQWKKATSDFVRAEVLDHEEEGVLELSTEDAPGWVRGLERSASKHSAPDWWRDEAPRLTLTADGLALPAECSWGLASRVANEPVLDLSALTELDPRSTARLAEATLEWWHEAPRNDDTWPIGFAETFPNEASTARLERLIREKKPAFRSATSDKVRLMAIACLGRIDLPSARQRTIWLIEHHPKDKFRAVASNARASYCKDHDLSHDEYADRAVSDFGLDARQGRDFDYGDRTIRMKASGRELSFVDLSAEKVTPRLPRGTRKDDTDKVKRAREAFKVIGKSLRAELDRQRYRFESGMLRARRWHATRWREDIHEHPLLGAIAGGLVWAIWEGDRRVALARPDEEGNLIDVDFDEVLLSDDATLSIPHPLDLEPQALDAWQEHLLGFEIIQPFDQMGRSIHEPDAGAKAWLEGLRTKELELDVAAMEELASHDLARLRWAMHAPRSGYAYTMHLTVLTGDIEDDAVDRLSIECPYNSAFSSSRRNRGATTPYIGMEYGTRRTIPRGDEDASSALDIEEIPTKLFSEAMVLLQRCAAKKPA